MPDDDPADLERFWNRLQGPRPRAPEGFLEAADRKLPKLAGGVWAAPLWGPAGGVTTYGSRILISESEIAQDETEIAVHCVFPPAAQDCQLHAVALWERETSIQPLAVVKFNPVHEIQRGDSIDCTVNITF